MNAIQTYFACLLISLSGFGQNSELILNSNWQFKQIGKEKYYPAEVPGTVHTDLFKNKLIPDPFFADNEQNLQWIENENWEYKTEFTISNKQLGSESIQLVFEELDTYAKVYLNDSLILTANNMFRKWNINAKPYLQKGKNKLSIVFESAVKKGKEEALKLNYVLPGDEKVFTRKAQYQYGWDWGPRFITCGISKNIKLRFLKTAEIKETSYSIISLNDTLAEIQFNCKVESFNDGICDLFLKCTTTNSKPIDINSRLNRNSLLKAGINDFTFTYTIKDPKRWWCNGLGEPFLYNFQIILNKKSGLIDEKTINVGLRTIELIQEKDSVGQSFYFKLNGIPVFMKGANYIPSDNFLSRIKEQDDEADVLLAKKANMNMLRVWGGGAYGTDAFYNACDKHGILVWQDFMFACAMYPGDSLFIANVKTEAEEQVKRLRNHPSLALWCGNNESDEGWKNWGWQKQFKYAAIDSAKIWNDYQNLFHKTLPSIVHKYDSTKAYWPSSPKIGWGHKESLSKGDSHYWGVWWGNEPFSNYEYKVGRFVSEYGFQSMPDITTLKTICDTTDLNFNSPAIKNHQKHPTGYETIKTYMQRDYFVPKKFEDFVYVSQLLQARGMNIAIEAHRRAKGICMGTLFWQLNDCWPVTSWSAYDYYKKPKAFYFNLKRLFDNTLISITKSDLYYQCHIINNDLTNVDGTIELYVKDFNGNILYQKTAPVSIKANSSLIYVRLTENEIEKIDKTKSYISCSLKTNNLKTFNCLYYFVSPKELILTQPKINWKISDDLKTLTLTSNVLTKNINIKNLDLENNYFDLEPNIEYKIRINSLTKKESVLTYISLFDINSGQ